MQKACVVVPIYKHTLDFFEKISLEQLFKILSKYSIYYAKPKSLLLSDSDYIYEANVENFDDYFFQSTATYSELLLSTDFYSRFESYEYMLIYQLDAFVFSDRLLEFVNMGYDYIGAPTRHYWSNKPCVGNGGFSLRNIQRTLEILNMKQHIFDISGFERIFMKNEDNFFSYCGGNKSIDFTIPDLNIARLFSAQNDIAQALRGMRINGLPFGTHHWNSMNYNLWSAIIGQYGYRLPSPETVSSREFLEENRRHRLDLFILHCIRGMNDDEKKYIVDKLGLDRLNGYCVWGIGRIGAYILSVLVTLGVKIEDVIDDGTQYTEIKGIRIKRSDFLLHKGSYTKKILICSEKYQEEIAERLDSMGYICGQNYLCFSTFFYNCWIEIRAEISHRYPGMEGITTPIYFDIEKITGEKL